MFQGINRYSIKNFFQEQHKLEIKNDNFFVRGYVVADNAGDSYDLAFTGININRQWVTDPITGQIAEPVAERIARTFLYYMFSIPHTTDFNIRRMPI